LPKHRRCYCPSGTEGKALPLNLAKRTTRKSPAIAPGLGADVVQHVELALLAPGIYMGLSLAHLVWDAPLPEAIRTRLSADSDVHMLSHRMPATLLEYHRAGVNEEQAGALYFPLKDSWWERRLFGLILDWNRIGAAGNLRASGMTDRKIVKMSRDAWAPDHLSLLSRIRRLKG